MDKVYISGSSYFVDKNIKKYTKDNDEIDLEIFFGDELNKEEFLSYINSVDLFGNEKIAVLRNANKIKNIEQLVISMAKCQESSLIISSIMGDKIDQSLTKLFQNNGFLVIIEEQKKQKVTIDDVIKIFKEKNIMLNYNQGEIILNKCFNNLNMVENEADKLQLYILTKKEKIPVNTLIEEISGEKEETIFALSDAFGMRDIKSVLNIYSTMDNSSDNNFKIFYALSRRIYQIYLLFIDESFLKKVHPFQLTKIKEQQKKWKSIELVELIDKMSDLDKNIKTGVITIDNAILTLMLFIKK